MKTMAAKVVGPRDGKAGFLGSIGVRFMIDGEETRGGFSLVEHPMSQRALCRRLRIDKSPMVGLVDDLERLGLAERRRSDADRRVQDIHLTERGRAVVGHIVDVADAQNERTFGVLDDDEREQLHALLLRVAEATAGTR